MSLKTRIKGVLLDLDGTLLDTAPDMVASLEPLSEKHGFEMPEYNAARDYVSTGAAGLIRASFPQLNEDQVMALVPEYLDIYAARLADETLLFDEMAELLELLEANELLWGVVTNKPAFLTDPLMKSLNLYDRCACVVSGDTLPQRKPAPEPLLHGMAQAGLEGPASVYIGDADRDIEAGRSAGMITVAAAYGYILPDDAAENWQADHIIDSPAELIGILNSYTH